MNYFSTIFLVSLLLLWLGGSHLVKQVQPRNSERFPQPALQRKLPRS